MLSHYAGITALLQGKTGIILILFGLFIAGFTWDFTSVNAAPQTANISTTILVDSRQGWQWSGVWLDGQMEVTIEVVDGQWTHNLTTTPYNQGEGSWFVCAERIPVDQCEEPLPNAARGALIGRVGSSVFPIGRSARFVPPQAGTLDVRMNDADDELQDNDGNLLIQIRGSEVPAPSSTPVAAPPSPTILGISNTVTVDSRQRWQWSGIWLDRRAEVSLEVVGGQWTHQPGTFLYNQGEGSAYICADTLPIGQCFEPMPYAPRGALIGRFGSMVFLIGRSTRFVAPEAGTLDMRINDDDNQVYDNDGVLIVRIAR